MAPAVMNDGLKEPSLKNLTTNFGSASQIPNELLQTLGTPHVDSFNYFLAEGIGSAVSDIEPVQFSLPIGDRITLSLENVRILPPALPDGTLDVENLKIWPSECRQRQISYRGRMIGKLTCTLNGQHMSPVEKDFGEVPIMVKSNACNLSKLSGEEMIKRGEHADDWGGYFVIKGNEKLIRLLMMTRRNFPIAVRRSTWKKRGELFSDIGIYLRAVKEDHTATTNVLHFVTNGTASLMFSSKKTLYFAPIALILKSLLDVTDLYILRQLMAGCEGDLYYKGCILNMLRTVHTEGINSHIEAKAYIGKMFRIRFPDLPSWTTDAEVCNHIIKNCLAIHLESNEDKFNLYVVMVQKLFSVSQEKSCVEGVDSVMVQEVLLGGHLYQQIIKEKLYFFMIMVKLYILKKAVNEAYKLTTFDLNLAAKRGDVAIGGTMENFLATGNVSSSSGLGLAQEKGLVIMAENLNRMRYMAHFRAVHRGSYFQTMRTTEARQLLPDAWGFICPVHTPDGAPCGLLNHLTKSCVLTTSPDPHLLANIPSMLLSLGMTPLHMQPAIPLDQCYIVMLDGRVVGRVPCKKVRAIVENLRILKIEGKEIPPTLEICLIPREHAGGQYPGLFLYTNAARMMRPVFHLQAQCVELIGSLEQVYMEICVKLSDAYEGVTTHMEISDTNFLSNLACLIPMPDCNQSPRNMYQCQMGKQTMGTPLHTWITQAENKLYRLQTPASPLFRPVHYDNIALDDFPMGTNAIVAVISYTGYDMEDAMIINKSSYERGFAHGSIYKSEFVTLTSVNSYFGLNPHPTMINTTPLLDEDGLPWPGTTIKYNDVFCSYYKYEDSAFRLERSKSKEPMFVDSVRLCGGGITKACITFRITRNPSVGDKFASRAGQKGICSRLWPVEDLPFTETGMVPDIVFNPHGFPSRMTIAMMIEIMAGKSASVHGLVHDATPFRFSEKNTAIDYFGRMLEAGGYNYYGTEKMYSGTDGRAMNASIFFGMVHYQRLRHMVSDKWQVRSTGPIDVLTQQPVKGRRRGGGVRFGEMERDSLLSHGAAFLLQDRLFHCSDKYTTLICRTCGSIISCSVLPKTSTKEAVKWCQICQERGKVREMEIPYIFRYFVTQMSAVNIKIVIETKD